MVYIRDVYSATVAPLMALLMARMAEETRQCHLGRSAAKLKAEVTENPLAKVFHRVGETWNEIGTPTLHTAPSEVRSTRLSINLPNLLFR